MFAQENERKILNLYAYDIHHALIETTCSLLLSRGVKIDALCVSTYRYFKGTKTRWSWLIYLANFFINKLRIPKAQGFFYRIFHKNIIKHLINKYDIIDFHTFTSLQIPFADYCIENRKEFMIAFSGSDILRASDDTLKKIKKYLDYSKKLRMTSQMKQKILNVYGRDSVLEGKITGSVDGITIGNWDKDLLDSLTEEDIRIKKVLFCDFNHLDKIIVTIGYNGVKQQNHDKIISILSKLPNEIKNKIHLVLPMTYGTPLEHLDIVRGLASMSGISNVILDKFLTNKNVCILRKITDIFIMLQDTDAFSSSVKSHVYCQNICLLGEWLEYPMEKAEIYYLKVSWKNLLDIIIDVIQHFDDYKNRCVSNKTKMLPFVTWNRYIDFLCELYK